VEFAAYGGEFRHFSGQSCSGTAGFQADLLLTEEFEFIILFLYERA
jgi:hypothetical protein